MELLAVILPFVLLGLAVLFVAFSGGPGRARQVYLTRGGRVFRVAVPLLYLALGVAVPAAVVASRQESKGATGTLRAEAQTKEEARGKQLFRNACATCHDLNAVNAKGLTGPDLDELGQVTKTRILNAIENGGTGQGRMPERLLEGSDAEAVSAYVAKVAAR